MPTIGLDHGCGWDGSLRFSSVLDHIKTGNRKDGEGIKTTTNIRIVALQKRILTGKGHSREMCDSSMGNLLSLDTD